MKRHQRAIAVCLSIVLAFSGIALSPKNSTEVKAAEWKLVWSDEFNGTKLDTNTWNYEIGNGNWGWGNGEVEYCTDREDNVKVSDGYLQIIAKKENYGTQKYTSGRINTKDKQAFLYGKMEARLKVENGNQDGVWPQFWMMGKNISQVGWPRCGEIDIMRHANANPNIVGCLHWGVQGSTNHGSWGSSDVEQDYYYDDNVNNGINGWHTYGLIWDAKHMEWQVDGVTYFQQSITTDNAYCFQKEQYFLLNLALGGTGTGFTNNKTPNPDTYQTTTMWVDYVRVFTSDDLEIPTTKPVETIDPDAETEITYEIVDSVANCKNVFDSFFGGVIGWGNVTGSISNATNTGVDVHLDSVGDNLWQAQASLKDLEYITGNTYTYKCTITSDVTKIVRIKVARDGDGDEYIFSEDDIIVKAGEPYNYEKKITIPKDYEGSLNLYFGLAKNHFTNENIDANTAVNISIYNMSFVTEKKIITVVPTTAEPTTVEPTTVAPTVEPTTSIIQEITTEKETTPETTTVKPAEQEVTSIKEDTVKNPAKVKIGRVKSPVKRKLSVKWKKVKKINGYEMYISLKKNFKSYTFRRNYKSNAIKTTIMGLKSKKKYFVKIRAYKKVGKKKYYGAWSKVKSVKIK